MPDEEKYKYKRKSQPLPKVDPEMKEMLRRFEKMRSELGDKIAYLEKFEDLVPEVYRPFLKQLNPKHITSPSFREGFEKQKEQLIAKLQQALGTGKLEGLEKRESMKKKGKALRTHRLKGRKGWISMD